MRFNIRKIRAGDVDYIRGLKKAELTALLDKFDEAYHEKMKPLVEDSIYDLVYEIFFDKYPKSKRKSKVGHRLGNKQEEVKLPNNYEYCI